jgi:Ca2+-transporting ATPase
MLQKVNLLLEYNVDPEKDVVLKQLLKTAILCNDSRLRKQETNGAFSWDIYGDPTEGALVVAGAKARLHKTYWMKRFQEFDEIPI